MFICCLLFVSLQHKYLATCFNRVKTEIAWQSEDADRDET